MKSDEKIKVTFDPDALSEDPILIDFAMRKTKLETKYGKRLTNDKVNQKDLTKMVAISIGYFSTNHETGCDYIFKTKNIRQKEINQSMIYKSMMERQRQYAKMAYGILESDDNEAKEYILNIYGKEHGVDINKRISTYQQIKDIDEDIIHLDHIYFPPIPEISLLDLFNNAYIIYMFRFNGINYDGGLIESLLNIEINHDKKELSLYNLCKEEIPIPDNAKMYKALLEDEFTRNIGDIDCYDNVYSDSLMRYDYSLGYDVYSILDRFLVNNSDEFFKALENSIEGVYRTIPSKIIRYKESAQAKAMIDNCLIGDTLIQILLYQRNESDQKNIFLEKQLEEVKAELSKLKKEQNNIQKNEDIYSLRASTAEANFAEKEKSYQIQKQSLENANNNLQRENSLIKKENERLLQLIEDINKQKDIDETETLDYYEEDIVLDSDISYEEMYQVVSKMSAMVVGGHDKWHNQMKKHFPDWKFIKPQSVTNKAEMFRNMNNIIFATDYLDHSLFHNCMNSITDETNVYYVHKTNIKACVKELYEQYIIFQKDECHES